MIVEPKNIMTLVKLYTGLDSAIGTITHEKWSFDFYSSEALDDDTEPDYAGFDMTPELTQGLISIAEFAKAAASHVTNELKKPKELRKRVFVVDSNMMYAGPKSYD